MWESKNTHTHKKRKAKLGEPHHSDGHRGRAFFLGDGAARSARGDLLLPWAKVAASTEGERGWGRYPAAVVGPAKAVRPGTGLSWTSAPIKALPSPPPAYCSHNSGPGESTHTVAGGPPLPFHPRLAQAPSSLYFFWETSNGEDYPRGRTHGPPAMVTAGLRPCLRVGLLLVLCSAHVVHAGEKTASGSPKTPRVPRPESVGTCWIANGYLRPSWILCVKQKRERRIA